MCIRLSVIVLAASLLPSIAEAQLIQVERGYIRAPFVRVERGRGLRTRVRAPFVDVGGRQRESRRTTVPQQQYSDPTTAPQQQYRSPSVEPPPVGPAAASPAIDVAVMDWLALRRTIRAAEAELDRQLDQFRAAEDWRDALEIGTLQQLLAEDSNAPPANRTSDRLQQILDTYDRVSRNPTSQPVADLSGFQMIQSALRELLSSPLQRQRALLITAAGELNSSLNRMQNGATWVKYLRLPDSVYGTNDVTDHQVAVVDQTAKAVSRRVKTGPRAVRRDQPRFSIPLAGESAGVPVDVSPSGRLRRTARGAGPHTGRRLSASRNDSLSVLEEELIA